MKEVSSFRLTRVLNAVRNDPYYAVEVFKNFIEFRSIGLPGKVFTYQIPEEKELICFA